MSVSHRSDRHRERGSTMFLFRVRTKARLVGKHISVVSVLFVQMAVSVQVLQLHGQYQCQYPYS